MPETPDWSAPLQAPVLASTNNAQSADEGGNAAFALACPPGKRISVVQFVLLAYPSTSASGVLRGWVVAYLVDGQLGNVIAHAAISPESPINTAPILYGQAVTSVGTDLWVSLASEMGTGSMDCLYDLSYYIVG